MAYGTVTRTATVTRGGMVYEFAFTGTSLSGSSEAALTGLPAAWEVVQVYSVPTYGTATAHQPTIYESTGEAGRIWYQSASVATTVNAAPSVAPGVGATAYYVGNHNGGADNAETVKVIIAERKG